MKKNMNQFIKYKRINQLDIDMTLNKLIMLLDADITLLEALDIVKETSVNNKVKDIVLKIMSNIKQGRSISESVLDVIYIRSKVIINMIELIDEVGDVSGIAKKITKYEADKNKLIKNFVKSVTYPCMLLCSLLIFFIIANTTIIPIFTDIYKNQGYDMPASLKIFFTFGLVLKFLLCLIVLILLGYILMKYIDFKNKDVILYKVHRFLLYSKLYNNLKLYYIFNNISLLVSAGYQIDYAIEKVKNGENNLALAYSLDDLLLSVRRGLTLSEAFKQDELLCKWYVSLIEVSEETGTLDEIFKHISIILRSDIQYSLDQINTYLEPILIICLGSLVGLLVISLSTPLMNFDIYM